MTLRLSTADMKRLHDHAMETYPSECCGALVGVMDQNGDKAVHRVVCLTNRYDRETAAALGLDENDQGTRNRYIIDPKDLFRTEKDARAEGMSILGFYHSHPDHPAAPSKYDLRVASAGYSYVIVAVDQGRPREVTCWRTDAAREKFETEELIVQDPSAVSFPLSSVES